MLYLFKSFEFSQNVNKLLTKYFFLKSGMLTPPEFLSLCQIVYLYWVSSFFTLFFFDILKRALLSKCDKVNRGEGGSPVEEIVCCIQ